MGNQMSIFDFMFERHKPKKKIRLIELFAGIGAQYKALKEITKGTDYEVESYKTCEWAVPSIKAYNSIHIKDTNDYSADKTYQEMLEKVKMVSLNYSDPISEKSIHSKNEKWVRDVYNNIVATHNLVNIMEVKGSDLEIVDTDKYEYIMTYSFPCQDLSKAGKRGGLEISQADGGTRSGLLWEVERIITELDYDHRPNMLLMENVPDLIEKNFIKSWHKWLEKLEELGYKTNVIDILNSKDYGIPQNRRRVFCVSIKGEYAFSMPKKIELKYRLKDLLEKAVDDKYYLTEEHIKRVESWKSYERPLENLMGGESISATITTHVGKDSAGMKLVKEDGFVSKHIKNYQDKHNGEIPEMFNPYNEQEIKDLAPAQTTQCGSTTSSSTVLIKNKTKKGYIKAENGDGIDISSRMQHHRGTVQKGMSQTITCSGGEDRGVVVKGKNLKEQLCNDLIEQGKVKEGDIVKHSFTKQIMSGKKKAVEKQGEMITLTTRGDCFGVVVKDEMPKVIGGVGEKKSNGGTQYYLQDRIYAGNVANSVNATVNPFYKTDLRIRKLTPCETVKLMGFERKDYQAMRDLGMSDMQIYHCSGDSIVVSVLMGLFAEYLGIEDYEKRIEQYTEQVVKG